MAKAIPIHPTHLDLKQDSTLTIHWSDGRVVVYPVAYLRRMSPSADARQLRKEMASNPLAVLPASPGGEASPLIIQRMELVGRYAVRLIFSDGHDTGIYSWQYLLQIEPNQVNGTT